MKKLWADWQCNKCGRIHKRDYGMKSWTKSYCLEKGVSARLYRISGVRCKP